MAVKKFKPMTPGTRHKVIGTFDDITSSTPEKSLLTPLKSTGGRNNSGKMTVRYIGGGHKKMYRTACRSVRSFRPAPAPLPKWATRCSCRIFRWVR